jgi:predicted CxxxxCH...CXXCH cytochrome family protein
LKNDLSSPESISVHGKDVQNSSAAMFHGRILTTKGLDLCRECHARDFSGGTAKVSCATNQCHKGIIIHKPGILESTSPDFHATYLKNQLWDLSQCSQCHGADYSGGTASPTCNTCHSNPGGPEACNTCHGDFTDPAKIAPPRALNGATLVTNPKVGAHTIHLFSAAKKGHSAECNDCHVVPARLTSPGHIGNDGKAEVVFLSTKTGIGSQAGAYDFNTNKCSNTYCHGNFELSKATSQYGFVYSADKMSGLKKQVTWTQIDGTQTACGSCHGLPPTGHVAYAINTCVVCHQGVIDNKGNITNTSLHINGKVNVFDLEY